MANGKCCKCKTTEDVYPVDVRDKDGYGFRCGQPYFCLKCLPIAMKNHPDYSYKLEMIFRGMTSEELAKVLASDIYNMVLIKHRTK